MQTVIVKPISGIRAKPGSVVDSSTWKNEAALLRTRFLRPATAADTSEAASAAPARKG